MKKNNLYHYFKDIFSSVVKKIFDFVFVLKTLFVVSICLFDLSFVQYSI